MTDPPEPTEITAYGLLLRPWEQQGAADELAALRIVLSDLEMTRWNPISADGPPSDEELQRRLDAHAAGWASGTALTWCVRDAAGGAVLGNVSVREVDPQHRCARVGYWTLPAARGTRVASRALEAVSRWAFAELPVHRLELGHGVGHEASCRIAQRCGYLFEGTLREALPNGEGAMLDLHLHARLATDPERDPYGG